MPATLPTGLPLLGRWIRLELLSEVDVVDDVAAELHPDRHQGLRDQR